MLSNCPWQYLLSTEQVDVPQLPWAPKALLGSAVHKVIEVNASQRGLTGLDVRRLVQEEFGRRAMELPAGLMPWVYAREGINGVLAPAVVLTAAQLAFKNIGSVPVPAGPGAASLLVETNAQGQLGRERKFASTDLDMEGWPDLVYRRGDTVHVVDFKLGLGRDSTGQPKHDYILQVAAYGLMAQQACGGGKVVLELRSSIDDWVHALDGQLEAAVREAASQARAVIPKGAAFSASELTRLGHHCNGCSFRPGCPAYRGCLESGDESATGALSPFDGMGTIVTATRSGESWRVVIDALPNGRRVTIDGILESLTPEGLASGVKLDGYALATSEVKGRGTYIANFHLWSPASPRNSAFTSFISWK
jgi:hypothetical protein